MSSYGDVNSNVTKVNGTAVSQGNGTAGNGCQRVVVASDNTAFPTIASGAAKGSTGAAQSTVSPVDSDHNALDVYIRGSSASSSGSVSPGTVATYMSSDAPFTPGSSATDIWTMYGSSSKTVKIYRITIHYLGTTIGQANFTLLRRSSTNSGGTSSATTAAKLDSTNSSATATVNAYTANPSSLGTGAGQLAAFFLVPIYQTNNVINSHDVCVETPIFEYNLLGQPIVLRGTSEGIALNCGGTSPTGGTVKISIRVTFTEE